jgi:hypothetical protein
MTLAIPRLTELTGVVRHCFDSLVAQVTTYLSGQGVCTPVAHSLSRFTAGGGETWTVTAPMVDAEWVSLIGKTARYDVSIGRSVVSLVSGATTVLHIALPTTVVAKRTVTVPCLGYNNSAWQTLVMRVVANTNRVDIQSPDGAAFAPDNTVVVGQISFEVL